MTINKKDILNVLVPVLERETVFALVFGSITGEAFSESSDIDLAVYLKDPALTFEKKTAFLQKLPRVQGHENDVVFLDDADLIIAMQALANGEVVVNNEPGLFIQYKAGTISRYIDFKMSRKIIEDHLLKGRMYA